MTDRQQKTKKKISVHDFYFETPLYDVIDIDDIDGNIFEGVVDGFSYVNKRDTTYSISSHRLGFYVAAYQNTRGVVLKDKRTDSNDLSFFLFMSEDEKQVAKIGQAPSLATIQFADVTDKYKDVLSKQDLFMLKRAIGLAAHGTGIGSYVYLRRILEDLIWETYRANKVSLGLSEEEFAPKRIKEKIQVLKRYLPSSMAKLTPLYGIISKGIHELSEEECLAYFDTMKLAIELILKQKIQQKQEAEEERETIKRLQEATVHLSNAARDSDE